MVGMEVTLALVLGGVLCGECWQAPGTLLVHCCLAQFWKSSLLCQAQPAVGLELGTYFSLVLLALASGPDCH